MTETKQWEWGGWGAKGEDRGGVLGGIWRGRIKGVLRKRKDEKVMKDCQRAQVGKRAGLLVYIYLLPQEPKQNRWNIQLWPSSFLVSWVCGGLYASAIKTGTWAVQWSKRLHRCWLAFVYANICACMHMYRPVQMKRNNINQLNWQRPCFGELPVYGSRLTLMLSELTPLFINWLASPAGPQ